MDTVMVQILCGSSARTSLLGGYMAGAPKTAHEIDGGEARKSLRNHKILGCQ